ncbi:MAG: glycosyltransferase family 2 protein [Clostridia bacterium]|jgi:rhamnosyltransferase|nr:glycosyltransferase family 2 protein [Clostridia bacterium]
MKLAILMATYNGERFLREQIESILCQETDVPFDLIVRDDGSTDGTLAILEEYQAAGKLTYYAGKNAGAARGFIGLLRDHPGYALYAFADQDDVWNAGKVQKGIDAVRDAAEPTLYCTNAALVDAAMQSLGRNTHRERPTYNLVSMLCLASCAQGCTSVFNEALARVIREYPVPDVFIMHDSLLTCVCALIGGRVIYDHEPSMQYRMHGSNVFGMSTAKQGVMQVIKSRIKEITTPQKISMYAQAKSILQTYGEEIPAENRAVCETVIRSEKSLGARLRLVCSKDLKHDTTNKTLTKKLTILLGND